MREHSGSLAPDEAEVHMLRDLEDGSTEVHCAGCGARANLPSDVNECLKDIQCPNCQKHFVYRPWWEW